MTLAAVICAAQAQVQAGFEAAAGPEIEEQKRPFEARA
jgi:hypothetical protein